MSARNNVRVINKCIFVCRGVNVMLMLLLLLFFFFLSLSLSLSLRSTYKKERNRARVMYKHIIRRIASLGHWVYLRLM